jgi:hypothetical protein
MKTTKINVTPLGRTWKRINDMGMVEDEREDHAFIRLPLTEVPAVIFEDRDGVYVKVPDDIRGPISQYTTREYSFIRAKVLSSERESVIFTNGDLYTRVLTIGGSFDKYLDAVSPKKIPVEAASSPLYEDRAYGPPQGHVFPSLQEE